MKKLKYRVVMKNNSVIRIIIKFQEKNSKINILHKIPFRMRMSFLIKRWCELILNDKIDKM